MISARTWSLLFIAATGFSLVGCEASQSAQKTGRSENAKTPGNAVKDDAGDTTDLEEEDKIDDGVNKDTSPMPYLLTIHEGEKLISPLFLKYKAPKENFEKLAERAEGYESVEKAVKKFLADAMKHKSFSPARSFNVVVTEDEQINAFMDAYENVTINTGTVKDLAAGPTLALLCHEMAHSARNHAYKMSIDPLWDKIDFSLEDKYWESQVDEDRKLYKHDKAAYEKALKRSVSTAAPYDQGVMKSESEADIVGIHICGLLGMSPEQYLRDLGIFMDGNQMELTNSEEDFYQDGEEYEVTDLDDLYAELFTWPRPTHPENDERKAQISRIKNYVKPKSNIEKEYATTWVKEHAKWKKSLSLSLTSPVPKEPSTSKSLKDGKIIYHKHSRTCSHRHRRR